MVYAVLVSISRVTDNKHHPTDVLAGALLGLAVAFLSLYKLGAGSKDHRYSGVTYLVRTKQLFYRKDYTSVNDIQKSASVSTNEEMLTKMT